MPNIRPLSPELQEAAKEELGEDPNRIEKDLEHIKEWLKKQPHLTARTDDQFLITFLRGCKFSLERTKEKLDSFYTMRTALPEYFSNRDPMDPRMQEVLNAGTYLPLPGTDSQGRRVILQRVAAYDPSRIDLSDVFKSVFLIWDIMLREDDVGTVKGVVALLDMQGATIAHAMQLQPTTIKKTMTCFQMATLRPLSPELQEMARKELGEEPHRSVADVEHIKEWLKKQPHITARLDDQFLLAFLRGCKFSLERTKEKLDCHYTMKTAIPEYFACRDPLQSEMQELLKLGVLFPLPEPDNLGRRVLLQRMGRYDPSRLNVMHMFKLTLLLADIILMEDDHAMINGFVYLMDMDGVTISHALQLQPALIKKTMMCFQNGYPARLKAINYVNYPPTFDSFLQIFKPFLKDKIMKRIFLHQSMEDLYENIPKRVLPKDYGGEAPSCEELAVTWKKKVESYRDFYLEDVKYKCDEKKRPGKPKTQEDLFGIEGSFRKLAVD